MAIDLASFPFARQGQVPSEADTVRLNAVAGTEYMVAPASEDRAYLMIRNTTGGKLVYYYQAGDDANGFTLNPQDTARLVNRMPTYIKVVTSGVVCIDIGLG